MNLSGFENTKNLADEIQAKTEGEVVTNTTGTNNVNEPVEGNLEMYNKGVDFTTYGHNHVITEGIFSKKPKSGTYREPMGDDPIEDHPMIDVSDTFKGVDTGPGKPMNSPEKKLTRSDIERRNPKDRRKSQEPVEKEHRAFERRSGIEDRK